MKGTFSGKLQKTSHNKTLRKWYGKCTSANVYSDRSLLQEKAMEMENRLVKEELTDFSASNKWLEKWKQIYNVREKILWRSRWGFHNNSRSLDWTITRVMLGFWTTKHIKFREAWIFFKTLPVKGLMEKERKPKVARNLNNVWLLCSMLLLMALSFLCQVSSGDQKDHAILSPIKIH